VDGEGRVVLLSWAGDGESGLRLFDAASGRLGPRQALEGVRFAYAVDWLADGRVALRVPGRRDAPVFAPGLAPDADAAAVLRAAGDICPLAGDAQEAPFAHRLDDPPRYPVAGRRVEPLHRLSLANLARRGEAANFG